MKKTLSWELDGPDTQVHVCLSRGEAYGLAYRLEPVYTEDKNRTRTSLRHIPTFPFATRAGNAYVIIRGNASSPEYYCQDEQWRKLH